MVFWAAMVLLEQQKTGPTPTFTGSTVRPLADSSFLTMVKKVSQNVSQLTHLQIF
jgi:hypothetical protein